MKKKLLEKIIIIIIATHLEWYTRQSCLALTHLLQGLASPQYFSCCFSLAFLEDYCSFLSLVAISLCLDPVTWDPSAPFKRAASSSNTSSQSCWRYSNILLFFFFFSTTLCLLASFLAFSSASLLAF